MNNARNHNRDSDHANDNGEHANDNGEHEKPGGKQVAPAPAGGALTSLAALQTVLNRVDTASVAGRSGLPMMQFKREGDGTWSFGQKRIVPEKGSRWAVNPTTFKWGFICFDEANKPTERLVSVSQPKPDITTLPDLGFEWQEQWAVNMKCLDGTDAGTEVTFKASTVGGTQAVAGLVELVRDRLNSDQHAGKIVPIALLEKDSYPHSQFGKVWIPILTVVDWMPLDGPAPAPTPVEPTPPVAQPRRRRVA
jgi:hypothetical protein